ncbi:MAG: molybdopterin molybdotransferase MoeA [Oceanococcaceae bacterium]
MITLAQAEARLAESVTPLPARPVPVEDALHQVLSEDACAVLTQPQWPQVAMDGYAVALGATETRMPTETTWPEQEAMAAAGEAQAQLHPNHALRVTTGAALPAGADTVVIQENVQRERGTLRLTEELRRGVNIRPAGQDFAAGQMLVRAGTCLHAGHIALLRHAGVRMLPARPPPRVAIIVTGSELLAPTDSHRDGMTPDSNGPFLAAWCQQRHLPSTRDRCDESPDNLVALLRTRLPDADVVVITGGASVGPRDGSHAALQQIGARCVFRSVAQKPGKPMALYSANGIPVLLLPGNPAAVFCGAHWHLQTLIARLQGVPVTPETVFTLSAPQPQRGKRSLLLRAQVTLSADGTLRTAVLPGQLSHLLGNLGACNALLRQDPEGAPNATALPGRLIGPLFPCATNDYPG